MAQTRFSARTISSASLAIALAFCLTGAAAPADPANAGGYVVAGSHPISAEKFIPEGRLQMSPASDTPQSRLIDFSQWVQCFTLNDSDMVIKEYVTWWNGVPAYKRLRCGDAGFGYKHIRERHEKDWQAKLDRIAPSGLFPNVSWDDLMSAAVVNALLVPDWSNSNDRVITALPLKDGGSLCS